jgi:hypothetical protein
VSLERQDVRCRLDADKHAALVAICNSRGVSQAEFVEALLIPEIDRIVHEATVVAQALAVIPTSATKRDEARQTGNPMPERERLAAGLPPGARR